LSTTIEVKDGEHLEHRRMPVNGRTREPATKRREVRPAIIAQPDQLAVERDAMPAGREPAISASSGKSSEDLRPLRVRRGNERPS
jgi:hypothetical protein